MAFRHNTKYGWRRDRPDIRDFKFERMVTLKTLRTATLPAHVYLRRFCSQITDQGQLGSCTANALTNLLEYNECANGRGGKQFKDLSRLFVYYNERTLEGTAGQDAGAELRDGIKSLATYGVCPETEWPYVENKFAMPPTAQCYGDAIPYKIHSYYTLNTLTDMRVSLANGHPFVFGFTVYESFESDAVANTGIVQMPQAREQVLGGHAVMAMGYNDAQQRFLVKNSWGKDWGLKGELGGYFTLPYGYFTDPNLSSDFWTVVKDI
jgi:C1A family cysteine protease